MHPLLLPGTHLLRRVDGQHQAGLDPRSAVLVPRPPGLPGGLTPDEASTARLLRTGAALLDDRAVRRALPAHTEEPRERWPRHAVAALARRCGDDIGTAVAARDRHVVVVRPFGHPMAAELASDVVDLCGRSGLRAATHADRSGRPAHEPLVVLVGVGEPHRELLDPLVHEGVAHLLVRLVEGDAVLGPLVAPGRTACLRCLDVYRSELDPSWPLLVEQYARASAEDRADGIPEPVDAALAAVAVGWAVRDASTYAEGGSPTTWSATVRLSATLELVESRRWTAHGSCGCTWG